jgi:hypothetical protein
MVKLGSFENVDIHCKFCFDTTSIPYLDKAAQTEARISRNFIHTLKENLQRSPLFENSKLNLVSDENLISHLKNFKPGVSKSSLLIVLDSIYLKDTIVVQRDKYRVKTYAYGLIHRFGCRTYDEVNMQLVDNHLLEDTAFWPAQYSEFELMLSLPSFEEIIWDTGIQAGERYAHYLAPRWEDQSRFFFLGNNDKFKRSYDYLQHDKLDSALTVLLEKDARKVGATRLFKTLYNTAVVYELKDDFSNALIMADSAYAVSNRPEAKDYADVLRKRKIDKLALDWQLE